MSADGGSQFWTAWRREVLEHFHQDYADEEERLARWKRTVASCRCLVQVLSYCHNCHELWIRTPLHSKCRCGKRRRLH